MTASKSRVGLWVAGSRPRTLPASLVPVLVGTFWAAASSGWKLVGENWWRVGLAALVSLSLQIGVNYANDYSDGVKGTDDVRTGPLRLVGSGSFTPRAVRLAAFICFGVAAICGFVLAAVTSWVLLVVGAACIAAAWFYTGGPNPYGYIGLGEVFVFVFFGLVATAGTAYVVTESFGWATLLTGVPVGFGAVALLMVNNLRDIPTDAASGKRTLAVRIGDKPTRVAYRVVIHSAGVMAGLVVLASPWESKSRPAVAAVVWIITWVLAASVWRRSPVRTGATGAQLIPALGQTSQFHVLLATTMSLAFLFV